MVAAIIVIVLMVALIVVDVFLVLDDVPGNTWSEMLRNAATHTTFAPWGLAVIAGRWFHPVDTMQPLAGQTGSIVILMVGSWLVVVIGDILRKKGKPIPGWVIVLIGLPMGALFCPVGVG